MLLDVLVICAKLFKVFQSTYVLRGIVSVVILLFVGSAATLPLRIRLRVELRGLFFCSLPLIWWLPFKQLFSV